jgi:hypothetical protein
MDSNFRLFNQDLDEEDSKFEADSLPKISRNPQKEFHRTIDKFLELNIPEGKNII